jgi:hypothetical protein
VTPRFHSDVLRSGRCDEPTCAVCRFRDGDKDVATLLKVIDILDIGLASEQLERRRERRRVKRIIAALIKKWRRSVRRAVMDDVGQGVN